MRRLLFALIWISATAGASSRTISENCLLYLRAVGETLARPETPWDYPSELLKSRSPGDAYPAWLKNLEDHMVHMFLGVPPELRDWEAFRKEHELSAEEMQDLRAYYGLNFFNHVGIVDAKADLIAHARKRSFEEFLKRTDHPVVQRYAFYRDKVKSLSVPEMAAHFGIREGEVYRDLARLNISLAENFRSGNVNPGSGADTFGRHHAGLENRGVEWNRIFRFRGRDLSESEILVQLNDEGYSYAEIAIRLNEMAGIGSSSHPDIRTEASVANKMSQLGLSVPIRASAPEVLIEPYGLVKSEGKLLEVPASEFLVDHPGQSLAWYSERLGVEVITVRDFISRKHLAGIMKLGDAQVFGTDASPREAFVDAKTAKRTRAKFARNLELMDKLLDHLAREDVKTFPSLGKESPNLDEVFGMRYHAWVGARDADRNYNPSWTDALTGTLTRLEMRKRDFGEVAHAKIKAILEERLVRARFESMTPDQKNLVLQDRLIDWLVKPEVDKFPLGNKAANNFSEILGVSYGYFVGIGPGSERGTSVNASWTDALTLTLARLQTREATIPKEHFEKAKRILEDRLTWAKGEAMSPAEENIALQDLLVDWLLKPEVKAFPPSTRNRRSDPDSADKPLDAILGINSQRFVGSDFRGKNLNPSWSVALRGTLARLELRKEKVESTHLEKAKKIVEERLARAIFDELPRAEQNVILQDRLIDWLLRPQTNSFPVTVKDSPDSLSLVLQIHYINFIGRAEKSEHNHNASWSEALERTLARLGSRKESIVDKIAFAKAKRLLEERLDVANFDKLSTAEQNVILQDRLIDWLLKPEVDTFPVANTRGENTLGAALGAQYNMFVGHETGGVRYNASWTEALLMTLARLESRKDKTGGAAFAKAKKLIEDRLGKARFDELSPEQQNEVLQDRLITWLARPENTEFPTASAHDTGSPRNFSVVLDMNYQRFVGSSKPRSGTSYNASWRVALERTLARLDSRRGAFEPAVYAKVKGILETKLRAVK